jgi:hypothetical protein
MSLSLPAGRAERNEPQLAHNRLTGRADNPFQILGDLAGRLAGGVHVQVARDWLRALVDGLDAGQEEGPGSVTRPASVLTLGVIAQAVIADRVGFCCASIMMPSEEGNSSVSGEKSVLLLESLGRITCSGKIRVPGAFARKQHNQPIFCLFQL